MRVLLVGYNGASNTGAESLLLADIADVRAVFGDDAHMTVPTVNEANLRRYLHESPTLHIVPMGQPSLAYAGDAGTLKPFNRRLTRRVASTTHHIIARSGAAAARLGSWGVTAPIATTADNAFTYQTDPADEGWPCAPGLRPPTASSACPWWTSTAGRSSSAPGAGERRATAGPTTAKPRRRPGSLTWTVAFSCGARRPSRIAERVAGEVLGATCVALRAPPVVAPASYNYLLSPDHPEFEEAVARELLGPFQYDGRIVELIRAAKGAVVAEGHQWRAIRSVDLPRR